MSVAGSVGRPTVLSVFEVLPVLTGRTAAHALAHAGVLRLENRQLRLQPADFERLLQQALLRGEALQQGWHGETPQGYGCVSQLMRTVQEGHKLYHVWLIRVSSRVDPAVIVAIVTHFALFP